MERYSDRAIEIINELHTARIDYENEYIPLIDCANQCAAYEDTGMTPEAFQSYVVFLQDLIGNQKASEALDRFRQLVKADRDGRLAVLPCQSGEHVFALLDGQKRVRECEVKYAVLDGWLKVLYLAPIDDPGNLYSAPFGAFGQSVFLTCEEAEKALEAMKDG